MSGHDDTIFGKIIRGEVPCHRLYEDDQVLAFLDVNPISFGHSLVIPKEARAFLHQLSDESCAAIGRVLPRMCRAVMQATGAVAYNILQNNGHMAHQAVMHVHFHIIPRYEESGLGVGWTPSGLSKEQAAELVAAITAAL
ncbi:MAG TPA: HIT family protein [Candidatus Binatia bacterium]|nr:HIT family protein [Candidatus Binatia bacterium]